MKIISSSDRRSIERLLTRSSGELARAERTAARVISDIRRGGDRALLRWTKRFLPKNATAPRRAADLTIGPAALEAAWQRIPAAMQQALRDARRNIEQMARWQMPADWRREIRPGVEVGQLVRPLASVGCYVPGGRHPLPSTALMTAIPARAARVPRVVMVCPQPTDEVLAAAHLAGVDCLYAIGGAQAVAALAYGTESVPRVAKIAGPGNIFVTAAKRLVANDCGIDFLAGPTEVLLVAEDGANPRFLAADLIAQAEHDPQAAAWLLTPSRTLARAVARAIKQLLAESPNPIALQSLAAHGALIVARDMEELFELVNRIAPEHITVPKRYLDRVQNAGSIFLGEYSPEAAGDYLSGTNHCLPTASLARLRGGLSVLDFVKIITVQELTPDGLRLLAPAIATLARAEGLEGHARSVELRLAP